MEGATMAVYLCNECKNAFISKKKAEYCSAACRSKAYYRNNTDKCKYLTKLWEQANPDKVKQRKKRYAIKKINEKL